MGVIADIHKGTGMSGLLRYVLRHGKGEAGGRPVVIDRHHIHGGDLRTVEREFALIRSIAGPGKHVLHVPFSWRPEECPDRETRADYVRRWAQRMGYGDCPYLVVEHRDTDIVHDHLALLRVDGKGEVVHDSFDFFRSSAVRDDLDREFGLRPERRIRQDALDRPMGPGKWDRERALFREALDGSRSWRDLREALAVRGADLVVTRKSGGEIQGIGIRTEDGGYAPASKMHRSWSYARLGKVLAGDLAELEDQAEALAWLRSRPSLDEIEGLDAPLYGVYGREMEEVTYADPNPRGGPVRPGPGPRRHEADPGLDPRRGRG